MQCSHSYYTILFRGCLQTSIVGYLRLGHVRSETSLCSRSYITEVTIQLTICNDSECDFEQIFHGRNFFSLYLYYNKKPYQRQGVCDTYITVHIYLRNTLSLVRIQSVSTVQNTISKPRLFIFQSSYEYQPPSFATYIVWLFCQFLTFHFCGSKGFSYGKKNFESDNIQRSILVRCRLGKLAFFIIATPVTA